MNNKTKNCLTDNIRNASITMYGAMRLNQMKKKQQKTEKKQQSSKNGPVSRSIFLNNKINDAEDLAVNEKQTLVCVCFILWRVLCPLDLNLGTSFT